MKMSGDFCFMLGRRLESECGHPASMLGRASRVEKFLRATASKNVLDQVSSSSKEFVCFCILPSTRK